MPLHRITRSCLSCCAPFLADPYYVRKGEAKYCSRACYWSDKAFSIDRDFWPKVDQSGGPESCWRWLGNFDDDGYGRFRMHRRRFRAHRVAWELANGRKVPNGLVMRHLCPGGANRWCCNPHHLSTGTVQDNADDTVRDARHTFGERNVNAKLNAALVREIRARHASGASMRRLARELGVNDGTIGNVVRGRTWKHVS